MNKDVENKAHRLSSLPFVGDLSLRETLIADMIQGGDIDLAGMLAPLDMQYLGLPRVCWIYARVVMGHEDQADCREILIELRSKGFVVPECPGQC